MDFGAPMNVVIENHPSIARAAALISQEKIIFSMVLASPCFTEILTTINLDDSL